MTEKSSARRDPPDETLPRTVFIVAPPRSGGDVLFRLLAESPSVYTLPRYSWPAEEAVLSDRLNPHEATAQAIASLNAARRTVALRYDGTEFKPVWLEHNPQNALRIAFLAAAYPDARFVYLYRDPRESISRMLDAWRSGTFVTHQNLEDWPGPPWSLPLIPDALMLAGKPLAEIVARQWQSITNILLDDLDALPPERWCVASFDRLLAAPAEEAERLCAFLQLAPMAGASALHMPSSTSPNPDAWRHNAAELRAVMPSVLDTVERARQFFARTPAMQPETSRSSADRPARFGYPQPAAANNFGAASSAAFTEILDGLRASLAVTTRCSHRLALISSVDSTLRVHLRTFGSPLRLSLGPLYLALIAQRHVWLYRNQPQAASAGTDKRCDAMYFPQRLHVTGDLKVRDAAWVGEQLWLTSARFSCLATLEADYSFHPRWRPAFISALAAEDRCHLNGMAVDDGGVKYVTALSRNDNAGGWKARRLQTGVVIDTETQAPIAEGLCLPHSPRWYRNRLWWLEAGRGTLVNYAPLSGRTTVVAELPGFTRGLAFAGDFAFVGVSRPRAGFAADLPLLQRCDPRDCGIWIVDLREGTLRGLLRFQGPLEEVLDLAILPGIRAPELVEPEADIIGNAFVVPEDTLAAFMLR
ncbi:MAG: TIGR03032 family protein [Gammaproteobacteria bacterium]